MKQTSDGLPKQFKSKFMERKAEAHNVKAVERKGMGLKGVEHKAAEQKNQWSANH